MTNIVSLRVPHRRHSFGERAGQLSAIFAQKRRLPDDVFWLKENAEFLNIVECTGIGLPEFALENWAPFYDELSRRLSFFPQYYRFFVSITLDLEDLGMPGNAGEEACNRAERKGLAEAELSDLQRGEARRLLARRGANTQAADSGLDDRLRAFVSRAGTFALPNKKAAYELTHIVFYLSEYGRRDPQLPQAALISLEYAGVLAMLEQNMDLLAEVCIALRYAGKAPSATWESRVIRGLRCFEIDSHDTGPATDDYHEYLVSSWSAAVSGDRAISQGLIPGHTTFRRNQAFLSAPLRSLSSALYDLDHARSGDWNCMRPWVFDLMDDEQQAVLAEAESSSPHFESFFEGFARAHA
ncbi:MAG: hypothetical protein ABJG55_07205 [Paracoccaceae bacterium]